jgi:hypothetical protein
MKKRPAKGAFFMPARRADQRTTSILLRLPPL